MSGKVYGKVMRKSKLPDVDNMTRNIVKVYASCSPTEIAHGAEWYPAATARCIALAEYHGLSVYTAASVVAALSPQCPWRRNLEAACDLVNGRPIASGAGNPLSANVAKARSILRDRATSPIAYFVDAPKVESFARNLVGDLSAVTVDTHAMQIALADSRVAIGLKRRAYDIIAAAYRQAAMTQGVEPATLQAVTWCRWKALHSAGAKRARMRDIGRITSWAQWREHALPS
jgi:hypothetical protein